MDFWGKRIIHFIEEKKYAGAMRNMALVLAVAVIFVTTYMLVLPAVTIDRDTAATEAGLVLEDTAKEEAEEADAEEAEAGEAEAAKTGEAEAGDTEADSEITGDTGSDVAESGDTSESERQNHGDLPAAEAASGETVAKDPAESPAAAETGAEDTAVPEETAHQTAAAEETEPPAAAVGETEPQPAAGELTCELKDVFAGITYGPEANIPPGSTLSVKEIEEGTEEYDAARNAVLADKKEKGEFVDIGAFHLAALDISILDPDGKEIEPEAAVQVDLRIKDLPGIDDLDEIKDTLEIQHHVEAEDGVVVETVFDGKAEGAYSMDTDERIAAEGTAVDPDSVSDRDFGIRKEIRITAKPAVTDRDVSDEEMGITASFDTPLFSTFTITWERGAASNSTTTLRWRDGNSTRGYVTVHY